MSRRESVRRRLKELEQAVVKHDLLLQALWESLPPDKRALIGASAERRARDRGLTDSKAS